MPSPSRSLNGSATGWTSRRRSAPWAAALSLPIASALASGLGCESKVRLVPMPDSPALVLEAKGTLRVAMYDPQAGKLVQVGWIDATDLVGLTVVDYDWTVETRPVQ